MNALHIATSSFVRSRTRSKSRVVLENKSRQAWTPENFSLGWQFFDPETNFFILEGAWAPVPREVPPGQSVTFEHLDSFSSRDRRISNLRVAHPAARRLGVSPGRAFSADRHAGV